MGIPSLTVNYWSIHWDKFKINVIYLFRGDTIDKGLIQWIAFLVKMDLLKGKVRIIKKSQVGKINVFYTPTVQVSYLMALRISSFLRQRLFRCKLIFRENV